MINVDQLRINRAPGLVISDAVVGWWLLVVCCWYTRGEASDTFSIDNDYYGQIILNDYSYYNKALINDHVLLLIQIFLTSFKIFLPTIIAMIAFQGQILILSHIQISATNGWSKIWLHHLSYGRTAVKHAPSLCSVASGRLWWWSDYFTLLDCTAPYHNNTDIPDIVALILVTI